MRQPMGLVDVDATGCFDRMVGRLLSLINQCNGMTQQAASCQAEVLHNMKHFVKTTKGISDKYIQRDNTHIIGRQWTRQCCVSARMARPQRINVQGI